MNRAELLAAARRAANVAPSASPLDTLRGVLLEADAQTLTLTATNMEVALEQKIPCSPQDTDAFVVNADLFAQMLEKLDGEMVELRRDGEHQPMTVKGGEATFRVQVWERGSFPKVEIPFPEDTVKVAGIPGIAKRTMFAVDPGNTQPLLKCVNLMFTKDGLRAVGSDGSCVVSAKGDDNSTGDVSLLLPALSLNRLARMCGDKDEFRVGTTGKTIVFFKENFAFSARLMDGSYVDSDRLIGSLVNSFTVLTDVPDLRKALLSATAVDQGGTVQMLFEEGRLTLSTAGEGGVSGSMALEIIPLTGIPRGAYWYRTQQLSACLSALTGTVTLGIAQGGLLTLSTEDAFYMQTGQRPPATAVEPDLKAA